MDHFILGLLMMQKLTAYELHVTMKNNYQGICSSSLGNIQRALKKLSKDGDVTMNEVQEGKIVKKIFSITAQGRSRFLKWLNNPIMINRVNNMEIGRLLLLGFLSKEKQLKNIDLSIQALQEDYEYMQAIVASIQQMQEQGIDPQDPEQLKLALGLEESYLQEMLEAVSVDNFQEIAQSVQKFSLLTLKFGVEEIKFQLDWFLKLREELKSQQNFAGNP